MAQISIIKKSDIAEAGRFDAEYFKPEYLEIFNIIKQQDFLLNSEVSIIKSGTTPRDRDENLKSGVVLLKTGNIRNNILSNNAEDYFYISDEINNRMTHTKLKAGDVLLNIVGATTDVIGRSSFIPNDFLESNITQAMAFCRVFNKDIKPEYLFIFFQTKFGKNQTKRLARPTGQFNLNLQEVGNFLIPVISKNSQLEIEKIVKEAHQKQSESKQLYTQAENLLLEELGLVGYQPKHQLTFSTLKSEIEQAGRFDSEYFQPKYFDIISHIENYAGGFETVKNIVDWKKGIEVGTSAYSENGKDFVRVSDISINGIEQSNKKISTALFSELKQDFQAKKDEILFTKDGTIGISYLLKEDTNGVISSAFLRLKIKEKHQNIEKECLTLILNSVVCKLQIEQLSGGAIIAHLKPSDFERFKIPLIKQSIQNQIAKKITQSHALRQQSKELLELAKTKVEQEIERS
jgi:restriction endonuclease S subunit